MAMPRDSDRGQRRANPDPEFVLKMREPSEVAFNTLVDAPRITVHDYRNSVAIYRLIQKIRMGVWAGQQVLMPL